MSRGWRGGTGGWETAGATRAVQLTTDLLEPRIQELDPRSSSTIDPRARTWNAQVMNGKNFGCNIETAETGDANSAQEEDHGDGDLGTGSS
jgi:hypothetical protein